MRNEYKCVHKMQIICIPALEFVWGVVKQCRKLQFDLKENELNLFLFIYKARYDVIFDHESTFLENNFCNFSLVDSVMI